MKDLTGRLCLITGAASGIGRATALAAARAGARLFLTDIAADGLAETVALVRTEGGEVLGARALDVSDYDAVTLWANEIHEEYPSLDIVMNIAGIAIWGTVENLEHRHWCSVVEVNLMGPIHIIENFLPPMVRAGRGGHLVNVSSAAGLLALPWHAAYSASKFGLRGISEVLRFDLERHGIGVSLVVPGAVRTPLVGTAQIIGVDRNDPRVQRLTGMFEGHAATPERVAERIVDGVRRNRFLVHTSADIRIGYWFARKFALPYEIAMRLANRQFSRVLDSQRHPLSNALNPE
ncbi:NAD(P)-dependent dehydrogenase (short-subunit alcohol dehydrogenase family) [Nocardia sp. GAS34]|jgi:NAD(P)-dependent dehydrogenase (short-subunit alcohol dehydrogenase family)|uniref:SDR family oxidoreductase n=1 Tax=unclassified Nocardia TaxID=2637762 RepID=UPI003D1D6808